MEGVGGGARTHRLFSLPGGVSFLAKALQRYNIHYMMLVMSTELKTSIIEKQPLSLQLHSIVPIHFIVRTLSYFI